MPPQISIRNLGPIAQADLELKPLTIFVGPNNSGKSYAALTIYSLVRSIGESDLYSGAPFSRKFGNFRLLFNQAAPELDPIREVLRRPAADVESVFSGQAEFQAMPAELQDLVRRESENLTDLLAERVAYEFQRCFGVNLDDLGRRDRATKRGEFEVDANDVYTGLLWNLQCRNDELSTTKWEPDISRGRISLGPSRPGQHIMDDPVRALELLIDGYVSHLVNGYSVDAHYLPASRSGILLGHKTLASLIVGRASRAWIEPMNVPRLPGVVTDLIQALLLLNIRDTPVPSMGTVVEFLESNVTRGRITIGSQLEYPEIHYANESGTFQLHQVSSTVSEIAPLVLFLKYLIEPGNLFILEEPESHLDPANQRHLARAIAMMVNAGVRVLLTTHSDIFVNQINNLMKIRDLSSDELRKRNYTKQDVLRPEHVGAYLFRPDVEEGTTIQSIPVDSDYGISTESSDMVHRALYDEAIELEHVV